MVTLLPVTSPAQVERTAQLAAQIWNECYPPLIGQPQVDYMVANLQSPAAIRTQLDAGYRYYLVQHEGAVAGYAATLREALEQALFLSKIYISRSLRGKGIGSDVIRQMIALARQLELRLIWLTVNKNNRDAIAAYERLGFKIVDSVVIDIGAGFVMDDFRMEYRLA